VLFQSSVLTLFASYACKTVGPQPGDGVQYWLLSSAHTMPFVEDPREETDGVEPGNPKLLGEKCVAEDANWPVPVLKVY
jgi:hypothetical protein